MIDIRSDYLRIIKSILKKYVPDYKVLAFGSRVAWTAKEYSDLDLVVVSDTPLSPRTMALMKEAFSESDLPFKVDVLDWATTSDEFRSVIEKEYEVVQKSKSEWKQRTWGDLATLEYGKALRGYQDAKGDYRT